MVKQIRSEQLQPGMYIHNLNCGWLDHPFMSNTFFVRDQATCDKIVGLGIREGYIDALKGGDLWVRLESNRMGAVVEQNEGKLLEPVVRVFYHADQQHDVPPEMVDLAKVQDRIASCES